MSMFIIMPLQHFTQDRQQGDWTIVNCWEKTVQTISAPGIVFTYYAGTFPD